MMDPGGIYHSRAAEWSPASRMYPRYAPSYQTKIVLEKMNDNVEPVYNPYGGGVGRLSYYRPVTPAIPIADVVTTGVGMTGGGAVETCTPKPFYGPRYRIIGYVIIMLAILTFAFELANVIVTATYKAHPCNGLTVTNAFTVPWFFTWVVPGLWASVPIFITGILAMRVKDNYGSVFRSLAIVASLSAFFFAPAIVAIKAAEVATFMEYCGYKSVSDVKQTTEEGAKFALPIVLIVLGVLLMLVLLYLTYLLCKSYDHCVASDTVIVSGQKPAVIPLQPTIQVPVPVALPPVDYVPVPVATLPPPPPRDAGACGGGRLIFMETHNRGQAYSNVPGYFSTLPPPAPGVATAIAKPVPTGGYFWN